MKKWFVIAWFLFMMEGGREYVFELPMNEKVCDATEEFFQFNMPWIQYKCIHIGVDAPVTDGGSSKLVKVLEGLIATLEDREDLPRSRR